MSHYEVGGADGAFASFDAYAQQKQIAYWRWILAAVLLLAALATGLLTAKTFAGVEQAQVELPKTTFNLQPTGPSLFQTPAVAAAQDRSPELKHQLENWMATQSGSEWSFYVQSLESDELKLGINETQQFEMASIYKLFLVRPLAQKIPAEAWGSNNITNNTYLSCVQMMLALSDNPCAEAIAGSLGWSGVHRQAQSDGYRQTVLNRSDFFVSSVADAGLLLDRLYHGDGYDAKTKQIALDALGRSKHTEAIRKACNACQVYNKTGDLGGYKHDAAIVEKDGKSYVVVIFSKGAAWSQLTEAAGIISQQL